MPKTRSGPKKKAGKGKKKAKGRKPKSTKPRRRSKRGSKRRGYAMAYPPLPGNIPSDSAGAYCAGGYNW